MSTMEFFIIAFIKRKRVYSVPLQNFVFGNKVLTNIEYVEIVRQVEKAQINR